MKKAIAIACFMSCLFIGLAGCSQQNQSSGNSSNANNTSLESKKLFIYCGAGMKSAAEELVSTFKENTKADVSITYGNAAQIVSQITTSNEGDMFIAGDVGELAPLNEKDKVSSSVDLVKHVPVLAVKKGNPKAITGLNDLTKDGVRIVLGDNAATPIGKLADKALSDLKILDKVNIAARTATANEMTTALTLNQCNAAITWNESILGKDDIEVVKTADLDPYVKIIPAATLSSSVNKEATDAFLKFLDSDQAKTIWQKHGYLLADK